MRIVEITNQQELRKVMHDLKVDPYGIEIMAPKGKFYLVKIENIPPAAANILKQDMLSLGGDVAVPRDLLVGKLKKTNCLLLGNLSQIRHLINKLKRQPFGLKRQAVDLSRVINNYENNALSYAAGTFKFNLSRRTHIMGIINLTPDSFSGDGLYSGDSSDFVDHAVRLAEKMESEGADIIDIGGESSRPGAKPVSLKEELERTIPAIKKISRKVKVAISIDTYKPEVALQALDNGAVIINDISGLKNPQMFKAVAKYNAGVVVMHMKGKPVNMQNNPSYVSVMDEIVGYLSAATNAAREFGLKEENIAVDPGIGFGKTFEHNLEIIKHIKELKVLGLPILVGLSRKSFIGKILENEPKDRLHGTIASCVLATAGGANIVRVHDVGPIKEALKVSDAIIRQKCGNP